MNEPLGGEQAYLDIAAIAEASRKAIEASRVTVAFLEMLVKDWLPVCGNGTRSTAYRDLAKIEIDRMNDALEVLERLQYPSHFKKRGNGE